jgi:hypothetical protein
MIRVVLPDPDPDFLSIPVPGGSKRHRIRNIHRINGNRGILHRVPTPTPTFLYAREGTGNSKQFSQIKLRTCSALAPMKTPPINETKVVNHR